MMKGKKAGFKIGMTQVKNANNELELNSDITISLISVEKGRSPKGQ
jgi:hypothetical protein